MLWIGAAVIARSASDEAIQSFTCCLVDCFASRTTGVIVVKHRRHTPRKRGIQYAAASRFDHKRRGILDHPLSRVTTTEDDRHLRALGPLRTPRFKQAPKSRFKLCKRCI